MMKSSAIPARSISFGAFEFDPQSGELRKNGRRIKLKGQPIDLLAILLQRPGEVATREELQKGLWPADTHVDFEHSLNAAVKRLRAALGDSARVAALCGDGRSPRLSLRRSVELGRRRSPSGCSGAGAPASQAAKSRLDSSRGDGVRPHGHNRCDSDQRTRPASEQQPLHVRSGLWRCFRWQIFPGIANRTISWKG